MVAWEQKGAEAMGFCWQIWQSDEPYKIPGFGYLLMRCRSVKGQINTPSGKRLAVAQHQVLVAVHYSPSGGHHKRAFL